MTYYGFQGDPTRKKTLIDRDWQFIREEKSEALRLRPQQEVTLLDEEEEGYLYGFVIQADDDDVILRVILHGPRGSFPLIDMSYQDYLRLGIGMSPGEAGTNPNSTTKDPSGSWNPRYPYITRYKTLTDTDVTAQAKRRFTCMFAPLEMPSYRRLHVSVKSVSTAQRLITYAVIDRIVYEPS